MNDMPTIEQHGRRGYDEKTYFIKTSPKLVSLTFIIILFEETMSTRSFESFELVD